MKVIPAEEPRYAVVDFAYNKEDGRPQEKLVFIFWYNAILYSKNDSVLTEIILSILLDHKSLVVNFVDHRINIPM